MKTARLNSYCSRDCTANFFSSTYDDSGEKGERKEGDHGTATRGQNYHEQTPGGTGRRGTLSVGVKGFCGERVLGGRVDTGRHSQLKTPTTLLLSYLILGLEGEFRCREKKR